MRKLLMCYYFGDIPDVESMYDTFLAQTIVPRIE